MDGPTPSKASLRAAAEPLLRAPEQAAILLDLDGTLAPIAARPEQVEVGPEARAALSSIAARFGLAAVVTGRPALAAREIVGVGELTYVGNHGFEVLTRAAAAPRMPPTVQALAGEAPAFAARLDEAELRELGIRLEDKGTIVALHWRGAGDEAAAEARVAEIAARAERRGLVTHRGRKVLELRPDVRLDKGTAVRDLLAVAPVSAALYAGDDRTDLDAFAALAELCDRGSLLAILRVGVRSAEGPPEIAGEADLLVDGPAGLLPLLQELAG